MKLPERLSLWEPVPVGQNRLGAGISINLVEKNILIGGEPGGGKSVALSLLTATAALDPSVELYLFDAKRVELCWWAGCAKGFARNSVSDAVDLLRVIQIEMDRRYDYLESHKLRKINRALPLYALIFDEIAWYLTMGSKKDSDEFADIARDIVARGRAAGIIAIVATQKPSGEIVPTSLRDLFAFRWAMRCTTPQASDTILGQGYAGRGFRADQIPPGAPGMGWLLAEGGQPELIKSYYLGDDELAQIAESAKQLRASASPPPVTGRKPVFVAPVF